MPLLFTRIVLVLSLSTVGPLQQSLPRFIAYALYRSQVHTSVTYSSLILLRRLQKYNPQANGMGGEQPFMMTLMLATKILNDSTYKNNAWVTVSRNQFTHKAINEMERQMCDYLRFKLAIFGPMLKVFEEAVKRDFSEDRTCYPSYSYDMVSPRGKKKKTIKRLVLVPAEAPLGSDYASRASGYGHTAPLRYSTPAPPPVSGPSADPSCQPGQSRRRRSTSLVQKMPIPNIRQATIPFLKTCPPDSTSVTPASAFYSAADTFYQPRRCRCNSVIPMPMPNVRQPTIQMTSRNIEPPSAPVIPYNSMPVFAPVPVY